MDEPQIDVARVLPGGPGTFTPSEVSAILEVAYLTTQADNDLDDEELAAFRGLASALGAEQSIDAILDGFAAAVAHAEVHERLAQIAPALARPIAAETAYKVAFAMALCDLADSEQEHDFDDALVLAFGLTEARADELAAQVYEAVGGEDDDLS